MTTSSLIAENERLRRQLGDLMRDSPYVAEAIDVMVTMDEVNDRHGSGLLLKRIVKQSRPILSIRSRSQWGGQNFGDWSLQLSHKGRDRAASFREVMNLMADWQARSVLCVPFLADELLTSIAITAAFNAPLCAYIMDDQNIATQALPDNLMREFLERSRLRLATHPELREAYQQKYGLPFCLLPAVVPDKLIAREPIEARHVSRGALLGNFWDQSWFDRLCSALEHCRMPIDWFGNNKSPRLEFSSKRMNEAGIVPHGLVPEDRLAVELRKYPFVIVPVGSLDGKESSHGVAALSLPGRILFACAASQTPILIVGSERTCASRFVRHFGIGETAAYEGRALASAIRKLMDPKTQREMRRNAAAIGPGFSDFGAAQWLEESIRLGHAADSRFEDVFRGYSPKD